MESKLPARGSSGCRRGRAVFEEAKEWRIVGAPRTRTRQLVPADSEEARLWQSQGRADVMGGGDGGGGGGGRRGGKGRGRKGKGRGKRRNAA